MTLPTRVFLLNALIEGVDHGGFVSGARLGRDLAISRAAVSKQINTLRNNGFEIESVTGRGHRLVKLPPELSPDHLGVLLGSEVHFFEECVSTNSELKRMALRGAPEGTVVVTRVQTGGRGRIDRDWSGPRGGLWFSVLLRPRIDISRMSLISLLSGIAVARSIGGYVDGVALKWPNDVLVREKKVSGILVEMDSEAGHVRSLVVGVGVNLNNTLDQLPTGLASRVTTLREECGTRLNENEILASIVNWMFELYEQLSGGNEKVILEMWRELSSTLGRRVRIETTSDTISGDAIDVDVDGGLLVRTGAGLEKVISGDCIHLR